MWFLAADPCYGLAASSLSVELEKAGVMEVELYVGNLSKSTTGRELTTLFAQAGNVTAVKVITDRQTGESKGYAYVTMSAQSEADKAVSMLNAYSLGNHQLRVTLARPREQRGLDMPYRNKRIS
ncbi:MAG TPA: RNA-binding protein [Anaerolineales bacterium]|nr:RNA-binding protein [Anaerolineales bacterium]